MIKRNNLRILLYSILLSISILEVITKYYLFKLLPTDSRIIFYYGDYFFGISIYIALFSILSIQQSFSKVLSGKYIKQIHISILLLSGHTLTFLLIIMMNKYRVFCLINFFYYCFSIIIIIFRFNVLLLPT